MCSGCYLSKTPKVKKIIKMRYVDLKGVSLTHVFWVILFSFVWAAGEQRK
jgi:hypothetical protein